MNVSAYDARVAWMFGVHSDKPYPGKIRALAASIGDRLEISSYRARRVEGCTGMFAELITASVAAFVPVRPLPVAAPLPPATDCASAGWSPRPSDRLTARRTTGPPCVPTSAQPPGTSVISP